MTALKRTATACLMLLFAAGPSWANDLEDKVGSYTEDGISEYHNMGEPSLNVKSKVLKAKSSAKVKEKSSQKGGISKKKTDSVNMNSVVLGAGGTVKGDIIIIDQSKGPKTQIVDK